MNNREEKKKDRSGWCDLRRLSCLFTQERELNTQNARSARRKSRNSGMVGPYSRLKAKISAAKGKWRRNEQTYL